MNCNKPDKEQPKERPLPERLPQPEKRKDTFRDPIIPNEPPNENER